MTISTRVYNDQAVAAVNRLTGDLQKIQGQISSEKLRPVLRTIPRALSMHPLSEIKNRCLSGMKQILNVLVLIWC